MHLLRDGNKAGAFGRFSTGSRGTFGEEKPPGSTVTFHKAAGESVSLDFRQRLFTSISPVPREDRCLAVSRNEDNETPQPQHQTGFETRIRAWSGHEDG